MLRGASDAGYAAVRNPQEGTILTVARSLAERAEEIAPAAPPVEDALADVLAAGEVALARTTEQLDVLKQAGVVDAGGAGLLEIVRGIASCVRGEELPEPAPLLEPIPFEAVHQELSKFRYCTSFFVEGDAVDPVELEAELTKLGDSLLVVGGPGAVKVHVHTDEPGRALALGDRGRGDRGGGREEHARPDRRARRSGSSSPRRRCAASSRSARAPATGGSSRASGRSASREASR